MADQELVYPRRYKFKTIRHYHLAQRARQVVIRNRKKELERRIVGF